METLFDYAIAGVLTPQIEMGAYEYLWANGVRSFKQLQDRLRDGNAKFPSQIVKASDAELYYNMAVDILKKSGIERFEYCIEGTFDYPKKLYDADYPLHFFYYQGYWDLACSRGVSVVGTRFPSEAGIQRTKKLVSQLVEKGFTIFSGLASGIDTVAHKTALEKGGNTVAVIGTPLSRSYPKENFELQKLITTDNLVISQIPVVSYERNDISFNRFFFPERNKTMSALSEATIIVEAGDTSGTLIQAKAALKQGRKLFILNSCFENSSITWPAKFEKEGAIRVKTFEQIELALNESK